VLACIVIMIALTLFTNKTKMGKAMRAVSEDQGAARLMGVDVKARCIVQPAAQCKTGGSR